PHSTDSYKQGLLFAVGVMGECTGEYGHSRLQRIDLET
ncbi:glutaminyl-peptide cyclotransferase, partial [Alistipes putredinis]